MSSSISRKIFGSSNRRFHHPNVAVSFCFPSCRPTEEWRGEAASFKFSIYHRFLDSVMRILDSDRFSDSIKGILDSEGLPEKHSPGYYATMVHHDRLVHGRRLASSNGDTPLMLMFVYGNETYNIASLGFLFLIKFYIMYIKVGLYSLILLLWWISFSLYRDNHRIESKFLGLCSLFNLSFWAPLVMFALISFVTGFCIYVYILLFTRLEGEVKDSTT